MDIIFLFGSNRGISNLYLALSFLKVLFDFFNKDITDYITFLNLDLIFKR